ncbi:MAG: protein kinase [Verrucomicrobiales bacterium]|nr:protein kinase [Verrucomicrobiales bacterium]
MKFFCDSCGQKLEVNDEFAGQMVDCPTCESNIRIPDAPPALSPEELEHTMRESLLASGTFTSMTIAQLMEKRKLEGGLQISKDVLTGDQNLKYEYGELIARGGVGAIFLASDQNIRRNVAVKVLLEPENAGNEEILRFIEEAQVTGQLEHPSVVPVHDLGVDATGNVYYTMKMVRGDNLHTILRRIADNDQKTIEEFPLPRLINIFLKVCDAMRFAHSRNVIHRDLKPQNIMVGEFGEVLVMDWGLAKVLGLSRDDPHATAAQIESVRNREASGALATIAGTIFGTPQFMAPEQARGATDEMDYRTDVYSLGAILYNILSLRPPVRGKTVHEILTKVTSGEISAPTIYNTLKGDDKVKSDDSPETKEITLRHCPGERIPNALAAVVMKAMALLREDRYQSVSELQEDIEAYQGGFATTAEAAGTLKLAHLFIQRNKLATISAIAISLLGVGFVTKTVTAAREIQEVSRTASPEFVAKAQQALKDQKIEEAKQALETAIGLDRKSPDAWYERARIEFDEYQFAKALDSLAKAQDLTENPYYIENVRVLEKIVRSWQQRIKNDGKGVLPEHLIEMARELQDIDPTLAARFFFRVGSEQQALKIQVEDVFARLIEANPGLKWRTGKGKWPMGIYQFYWIQLFQETGIDLNLVKFCEDPKKLINISPLVNLPVKSLNLEDSNVSDITPLTEIVTLKKLNLDRTPILGLGALEATGIEDLQISGTRVDDLTPLANLPLKQLDVSDTRVTDFTPLAGNTLESFTCNHFPGETIDFLTGMPLKKVILGGANQAHSLEPLRGAPVEELDISDSIELTDISMLKDMPLKKLSIGTPSAGDLSILKGKNLDSLKINFDISDFKFLRHCTTRSITILHNQSATSLEGFEAQRGVIEELEIRGTGNECRINNIKALQGMKKLRNLSLIQLPVKDLSALKDLRPDRLEIILPYANDLDSLRGCQPATLLLGGGFTDLRGLRGMTRLHAIDLTRCTKLTQVRVLESMPALEKVLLPNSVTDIGFLRERRRIKSLNYGTQAVPYDQFWRSYDNRRKKGRK